MSLLIRAATAAALALALSLPVATAHADPAAPVSAPAGTSAARVDRPQLPSPTGPYSVGSSVLHLLDRSRTDPWVPSAGGRELMVTVHYPAARSSGGTPAPYATTEETRLLTQGLKQYGRVPAEELSAMRTHSRRYARPAKGKHPLVLLSPGFAVSRYTLTGLAEDLASRGYVVASLDHAYESFGIAVPGGRMLTCVACTAVDEGGVHGSVSTSTRAKDVSFVLDRLTGRHPAWRHAKMIDERRVGMAGHSIGGASAASAMAGDRRVDAGINMDGSFWEELPAGGLGGRPFMLLGTDDAVHRPGGEDRTWDRTWPRLGGWKRWLTVAGTDHFTFSDSPVIEEHFDLPRSPLPAARKTVINRTYVAAFFDQHLRGIPQPLLDGPDPEHPEVMFHQP
ncbi:alpha/beta hydrolase family protein [Streptomyces purpureus]|uniref:alpha/beta hydrolase family protein n=1 Tax=Streptomyces purpureus TaxID=1951 RepID=UPI000369113E|nr:hypothetical protein [Streptomyces purpureus]